MTQHKKKGLTLAMALSFSTLLTLGGGVAMAARPVPAPIVVTHTEPRDRTQQTFAERERQASPDLARFQGGDRIVIVFSSLALAVILGVVLVVVLL